MTNTIDEVKQCPDCGRARPLHPWEESNDEFCVATGSIGCLSLAIPYLRADRDKWRAAWQTELAANDRLTAELAARDQK
jgi:hypothetical protein